MKQTLNECIEFFFDLKWTLCFSEPPQYPSQPGAYYPPLPELQIYYSQGMPPKEPTRVYDSPRSQYHLDQRPPLDHYALRTPTSHGGHVIQSATVPISTAAPPSKTGLFKFHFTATIES